MVTKRTHVIAGQTFNGVTRGGGTETIEYVTNGPLSIIRDYAAYSPAPGLGVNVKGKNFIFNPNGFTLPTGTNMSENDVRSFGTYAMNASRPGYSNFNILRSAAEFHREGIPNTPVSEWREKTKFFKNLANSHLAYNFGWAPFVSDVLETVRRVQHSEQMIASARSRDNSVKVGLSSPSSESKEVTYGDGYPAVLWDSLAVGQADCKATILKTSFQRSWFEGTWQGFIPQPRDVIDSPNPDGFLGYAEEVLGAHLTPKVLWDLAPWSWLVDWSTGFGQYLDVLSNIMSDGLVLRNGFVMSHYRKTTEVTLSNATGNSSARTIGSGSMFRIYETKRRWPSVPYFGFNTPASYSAKQLSILAALGISQARK